ncbi:uncharacterized protein LOC135695641 isoform X2 [Rhopilema esculentum]|uniref:uncharacterized protein LOC135695641 isoform X2 n=1 Tax=Rhopilema esculentum TaxID=499914 RepID=UPI0031D51727
MKFEAMLAALAVCLYQSIVYAEVLELGEDEQGTPVWKNGEYRDRNEIPMPPSYDEEKKHKRATSEEEGVALKTPKTKTTKKNLINRGANKKGKKSDVPDANRGRSDRLNLENMNEYAKLDVQTPYRKSDVSKHWGMTYEDVFQDKPKETTGRSRSNLEAGYKISEEDLDNGMMFRGLGGLKLRDQNHQIIEGKFADEEADEEMNARSDVSQSM